MPVQPTAAKANHSVVENPGKDDVHEQREEGQTAEGELQGGAASKANRPQRRELPRRPQSSESGVAAPPRPSSKDHSPKKAD